MTRISVTVQHVSVHAGGQAVVGVVDQGGGAGDGEKFGEQPHARPDVIDAPFAEVRSENANRELVQGARDVERALSNARRPVNGGTSGKQKRP